MLFSQPHSRGLHNPSTHSQAVATGTPAVPGALCSAAQLTTLTSRLYAQQKGLAWETSTSLRGNASQLLRPKHHRTPCMVSNDRSPHCGAACPASIPFCCPIKASEAQPQGSSLTIPIAHRGHRCCKDGSMSLCHCSHQLGHGPTKVGSRYSKKAITSYYSWTQIHSGMLYP